MIDDPSCLPADATTVVAGTATGEPRYALIGASKGGPYVAATAAELHPVPVGVIAVGPPASIVSAESSRTVARAQDPSTFVELPVGGHGVARFTGETGPQVVELVDAFLATAFG